MAEAIVLEVQKRDITGKKVRKLRAKGVIPAVVYGPKQNPVNIMVDWPNLRQTLSKAGATHLVELRSDGDTYTTLIRFVDRHPVHQQVVLHVDFYAVDLTKPIVAAVPVILINVDPTEVRLGGQIALDVPTIDVETLPSNIPSEIRIDVSVLRRTGDNILVRDLPELEGVTYVAEPNMAVVRSVAFSTGTEEGEEVEAIVSSSEPEVISRRKEEFEEE